MCSDSELNTDALWPVCAPVRARHRSEHRVSSGRPVSVSVTAQLSPDNVIILFADM